MKTYITKRPRHIELLDRQIAKGMEIGRAKDAKKPNKYGAKKTYCTARHLHDSGKESRRCEELMLLEKGGEIQSLINQPVFKLHAHGGREVCKYKADFSYVDARTNVAVVEDVKGGPLTAIYRLKRKWMKIEYGITIFET